METWYDAIKDPSSEGRVSLDAECWMHLMFRFGVVLNSVKLMIINPKEKFFIVCTTHVLLQNAAWRLIVVWLVVQMYLCHIKMKMFFVLNNKILSSQLPACICRPSTQHVYKQSIVEIERSESTKLSMHKHNSPPLTYPPTNPSIFNSK